MNIDWWRDLAGWDSRHPQVAAGISGTVRDGSIDTTVWADSSMSTSWRHEARFEFSDSTKSSVIARARAGARSVITSFGVPWAPMAPAKNRVAALVSRLFDTNTSMTWPYWSTAR
jgi:antitoxin (DNA-binding transcriptional repressor) of toxin-antitoxin stability system